MTTWRGEFEMRVRFLDLGPISLFRLHNIMLLRSLIRSPCYGPPNGYSGQRIDWRSPYRHCCDSWALTDRKTMRWAAAAQPRRDAFIGTLKLPGTDTSPLGSRAERGAACRLRSRSGDVRPCSCSLVCKRGSSWHGARPPPPDEQRLAGPEPHRIDGDHIAQRIIGRPRIARKRPAKQSAEAMGNSGIVKNHKGVNVPGVKINLPALTPKDISDIEFGITQGIDFIAASFVRKASDVLAIREVLENNNATDIQIISKIENQEGVDNLDEILQVSDGLMVARGDLGVEIPTEEMPIVQKQMIKKCNELGKPVITATQMLDSMMRNPRPTRAEVTDVANAIYDGTDAIMLSGETAAGKYPVEAVKVMASIAKRIEETLDYDNILRNKGLNSTNVTNAISYATCTTAKSLNASAIITSTSSGHTARMVSKFKPNTPIIAATPNERTSRQLSLSWGVYTVHCQPAENTDTLIDNSIEASKNENYIHDGELVVITAGVPTGVSGTTNLIKVHVLNEEICKGIGIGRDTVEGVVRFVKSGETCDSFKEGDILVTTMTDKEMNPYIEKAAAIVTEDGGMTSHAAIVGINLGKPVVVSATGILSAINDGEVITVDAARGAVYRGSSRVL